MQPAVRLGEIEANLAHVEDLIRDAHREHGPDVITVPESMTTPNVYSRRMLDAARTVDGQPFQLLVRLAREPRLCDRGRLHRRTRRPYIRNLRARRA